MIHPMTVVYQAILGLGVFVLIPILMSENRKNINYSLVVRGFGLQLILAFIFTYFETARNFFYFLAQGLETIKKATLVGTSFVFGYIGGGPSPFEIPDHLSNHVFIFAFQALPMVIVMSALSMLLFYWNIIPRLVHHLSRVLQRTLHIGGAMGIVGAAKMFLGQIEASMLVRPYLKNFSRSEIFMVMCCGMSTTAATVMALYGSILEHTIAHPISHILVASVINVPCAITLARIIIPQRADTSAQLTTPYQFNNAMDAITKGTLDGVQIFLNIIAMLIVMSALVHLINSCLTLIPTPFPITLQMVLGYLLSPFGWLMGIPSHEAVSAGMLLGTKVALNEIFAFIDLSKAQLSAHSALIMTYALCGFSNLTSLGVMIAGIGALAPEKRQEITELGLKSVLVGTISTCLSGTFIGLLSQLNSEFIK